jgi:hypothetical protein
LVTELPATTGDYEDNNPALNQNTVWFKDADINGFSDGTQQTHCTHPTNFKLPTELTATSGDCNDGDAAINPNELELCDGKDNNCNGVRDENCNPPGIIVQQGGNKGINSQPDAVSSTVKVWPNPARSDLMVTLEGFETGRKAEIVLLTVDGRSVQSHAVMVAAGPSMQVPMGVGQVMAGYYLLRVTQGSKQHTKQVMVMR